MTGRGATQALSQKSLIGPILKAATDRERSARTKNAPETNIQIVIASPLATLRFNLDPI
jgi:hypothetical protein